ncbi:beta-galactosidase [Telmatobacter bradus]|uniref:beta-galactosidase n=1 Tax=Telmatobacter bradus TaxID=474953 RepID=UPI003B42C287
MMKLNRTRRLPDGQFRALLFAVFVALVGLPTVARAQSRTLFLGSAWYPEQWPEARWEHDLERMEEAHLNVVRVGEFAWSRMEPAEGHYDLDWLERAIRLAEKHHIQVVLGTPTDAPPAWLTRSYPETLRTDTTGRTAEHGSRRQFNYANPRYREFCAAIAAEMAKRFGHDANVIGWQIGNELTDESFDAATRAQFEQWLKQRYGTLDKLNDAWATAYWSQTYDRWDEIPLPTAGGNPGLLLEHRHFVTDTWRSFVRVQIDAIHRSAEPRQFITTNIGGLGWSDNFDHYTINEDLDLASWDDYVGQGHLNTTRNGFMHDFVRGWKQANFWVMETQPGMVNWAPINNMLEPGETRAMAWQAVGHGADAVLYWQWRAALNGQEQYHGTLVGVDGEPVPVYKEVAQTGAEFALASQALAGTTPQAQVALLHSYDSRWALDGQLHNHNYDQLEVLLGYYAPLRAAGQTVDVVRPEAALSGYKLIFAPDLNLISEALAKHLLEYVQTGGHLILGPRTGLKNQWNALNETRQPGPLAEALGAQVEQFYALDKDVEITDGSSMGKATQWAEQLTTHTADVRILLRYGHANGWLDHQTAMVERPLGKGTIAYLGAVVDEATMQHIVQRALDATKLKPEFGTVPAQVEVCRRVNTQKTVFIVINHGNTASDVTLAAPMRDLLQDGKSVSSLHLQAQDVAVLLTTGKGLE